MDVGNQGDGGSESPEANWVAASLSPRYDFHHHIGVSGRAEVFSRPSGGANQSAANFGTWRLDLASSPLPEDIYRYFPLELRGEIRHDVSDNLPFLDGADPSGQQTTFGVAATLNFENFVDLGRDPE